MRGEESTMPGPAATAYRGTNRLLLGIVLSVTTFWLWGQTLLNTIPALKASIPAGDSTINLAVSLTALVIGIFIVVAGRLSDQFGRMRFMRVGLALSVLGSALLVATAAAPTGWATPMLLLGRVLQGLSAAVILPASLGAIRAFYLGAERQRAHSFWSIGTFGGSALTSLVGGVIATTLEWRWNFVAQIVVSVVAYALLLGTPEVRTAPTASRAFDGVGLVSFLVGVVALTILINYAGRTFPVFGATTGVLVLVCAVFAVIFFRSQIGHADGFMSFELFRSRAFSGAILADFMVNMAVAAIAIVPAYVQEAPQFGLSALQSGLLFVGYTICILCFIRVGERTMQRLGARKPMILGICLLGLGVGVNAQSWLPPTAYLVAAFIGFSCFGTGLGFFATPAVDTTMANAPEEKAGVAGGIFNMASSLGASIGLAIGLTIATGYWPAAGSTADRQALEHAWNLGAGVSLGFVFVMMVVALVATILAVPGPEDAEHDLSSGRA